ncbi:hypothetical protein MTO96_031809 [Rhipicephalus appendiculatus]
MVAPSRVRDHTFAGRLPQGATSVDLVKALVKRFAENELKSVQDFGAGRFEVTFKTKVAVDRFLADSAKLSFKDSEIQFEFRGYRTTVVRVLGYPADSNDHVLWRGLETYGKAQDMSVDNVPGFKGISSGNRRVRMLMTKPVPNLFKATTSGTASARLVEFPTIQDAAKEGTQGTKTQPAPAVVEENGEKELESAEAPPTDSQKPAPSADNSLQAPSEVEVQKGGENEPELAEALPSSSEEATRSVASSPSRSQPEKAALPTTPIVKGGGHQARRRKRGGSRAKQAAATRDRSSSGPASSSSEGASPEYKRHAVTADDGDSSATVVEEPEMEQSRVPCSICGGEECDCSELSNTSYPSTPASPFLGEPVA